jgi:hypothetical protein
VLLGPGEPGGPLLRADCTLDLRRQTRCYAFHASIPSQDDDDVHLWEGQLGHIPELIADNGGPYDFSPTNMSSAEREWFVYTDEDLLATKVSGTEAPTLSGPTRAGVHRQAAPALIVRWVGRSPPMASPNCA